MQVGTSAPKILDLVSGLSQKKPTEFSGPCPWCGGNDRFVVWPYQGSGGRFMCRRCARTGDAIDILRDRGLSFHDAKDQLSSSCSVKISPSKINHQDVDRKIWSKAATEFIKQSTKGRSQEWLNILRTRHLSVDTAIQLGIGWNSQDIFVNSQSWGIPSDKKLRIPTGLVLPIYRHDQPVSIQIRCWDRVKNPKYWQIKGSTSDNLVLGEVGLPVIIVESSLDAFLIWQDAADFVSTVALNGTKKSLEKFAEDHVAKAPQVYVTMDFDESIGSEIGAGQAASLAILSRIPRASYFPTPIGKDPCEMVSLGVSIADWIAVGLGLRQPALSLPSGFPGSVQGLAKNLADYPHLVPCPKTKDPWNWVYREGCLNCNGHIQCIKDMRL
jgi:DNA primase